MPAPPPPTSGPPSPDPDPDGAAFDAFLELLERGEQPDPRAFVTARAGVSASLVPQLERLAAAGGPPPLPDRIGPYRILGLLGRGGMGTVYLGRDEELERDVAIKVLAGRDGRFVSEHRIERLRREARILAALDHSGIARVHAFGTSADGAPYIAMERVEGSDLQRTLGAGPLPWRDALDVLRATANALAEAHARGVVHRDLKPSNLILLEGGGVKLLDFGLGASAGELVRGSDGSSVHGTPGYMSPEQRRGEPHAPSDDVWALGRLGLSALGHGDVGHEDTVPEEWTLPREAPRDVPGALWNVLGSFLEPRGADRPQNGGAAERALIGAAELLIAGARERLPRARTRFVGRRSLLDDLRARLDEGGLTILTGPGGVGKTRAAHRVALERHEARWIALAGVRDGAVAAAVVEALGGRIGPDEEPLAAVERLAGELPSGTVVVLDNCEHVELEARAAALALLEGATVCATSRAPLGLGEERIVQVPPLEPAEAVALFEERARSAGARGPIEAEDTTVVAERLDRLPLALELAAARTPELGVPALRARLETRGASGGLLRAPAGARDERHRDLDRLARWSVDLLEPDERSAFARLAVFEDGWTLEASEAVVGEDALDRVGELTRRSLVTRDPARERWLLLETLRRVAEDMLAAEGDAADARARHAEHFVERATALAQGTIRSERAACFHALEACARDLNAALLHSASESAGPDLARRGLELSSALFEFWIARGRLREGLELHEAVMAGPYTPSEAEAGRAALTRGTLLLRVGRVDDARPVMDASLAHAQRSGERELEARVLRNRAYLGSLAGGGPEVEVDQARSLALYRELGDDGSVAVLLNDMGTRAFYSGEPARAVEHYEESLRLRRALGDEWGIASSTGNLGEARNALGEHGRARQELCDSLRGFRALGCLRSVAESFEMSAALEVSTGDAARAAVLSGASEGLRRRFGFPIPPVEESSYAGDVARMRELLGDERARELRARGAALELDEAIDVALGERGID